MESVDRVYARPAPQDSACRPGGTLCDGCQWVTWCSRYSCCWKLSEPGPGVQTGRDYRGGNRLP